VTAAPFPWAALPRIDRRGARAIRAVAPWLPGSTATITTGTGAVAIAARAAIALDAAGVAAALADPTAVVIAVRGAAAARVFVVAAGAIARALTQAVLGGPAELSAPRSATPAERGVLAYAVAAALTSMPSTATVELTDTTGPALAATIGPATLVELALTGAVVGRVALVVPRGAELAPPRRRLIDLSRGLAWLDDPRSVPVAVGFARVARRAVGALAVRDVVVVDGAALVLGRGRVAIALAPGADRVTVAGAYARGIMDETLGDDLMIELAAVAGAVELSTRRALELVPGEVIALGRPLGGPIELRVGRRVIARGELVDVDGELGVRVVEVVGAAER
jgi:hypothetical protein